MSKNREIRSIDNDFDVSLTSLVHFNVSR